MLHAFHGKWEIDERIDEEVYRMNVNDRQMAGFNIKSNKWGFNLHTLKRIV